MSLQNGDLNAELSLDFSQFTRGLKAAVSQAKSAGQQFKTAFSDANRAINETSGALKTAQKDFKDFERIVSGILLSQAFYGANTAIQEATASLVGFMTDMEKAQISMEYFLGDPEMAKGFIANMKDFAAETSFNTQQAMNLSKKLLNASFQATEVRDIMERLNDTAAVSGMSADTIDRIVLAMTQMKTSGKIMGTELRQLAEANIPVYKILAEQLGMTGEEILNIGELKVPSDIGIAAIFQGLEKFDGAALKAAQTMTGLWETIKDDGLILGEQIFAGPYGALKKFLTVWRNGMEKARSYVTKGGLGRVLEEMVPESLHTSIRLIVGSVKSLARSFIDFHKTMAPVAGIIAAFATHTLAVVLPVLAGFARGVVSLIQAAFAAAPALKYLAAVILGLIVANVAAKALWFLWGIMRIGVMAAAVGQAVLYLGTAIRTLFLVLTSHPLVLAFTILAGVLMYFALSSKTVVQWLDALMQRLSSLGGFDIGKILMPKDLDTEKWMEDFNGVVDGMGDLDPDLLDSVGKDLDDVGKKGKKAGDKIKDSFLAAFDEVFQVPEPKDDKKDDEDDGAGGIKMPKFKGLPDMPEVPGVPKLPDKIKLPKFEVPPIDWPIIPPWLTKPIKFPKFEIPKFPEFPNFPGAVVTSWEWSMNALRGFLKGFEFTLEGLRVKIPNLIPQIFPQGVWDPILEGLGNFGNSLGQAWDGLTGQLRERWAQGWGSMGVPVATWAADVLAGIGNFGSAALPALAGIGAGIVATLGAAWATSSTAVTTWASGVLTNIITSGAGWASSLATVGSSLGAVLGTALSSMRTSVTTWGAGVLASMALAGAGWLASLGTTLASIGTRFQGFAATTSLILSGLWAGIKIGWAGFSTAFSNAISTTLTWIKNFWAEHKKTILITVGLLIAGILLWWVGIPAGVGAALMAMLRVIGPAFARIGPLFVSAVKGIPGFFKGVVSKLPQGAQTVIGQIVSAFKALPGKIWEAIKAIPDKFREVFGKIKIPSFSSMADGVGATFKSLGSVAGFANGGIIGQDSIVRVGEKGRREAIVPLQNDTAMKPYVDAVVRGVAAAGMMNRQQPQQPQPQPQQQQQDQRPILYVGTLIADDRGLKELDRRMKVVQDKENARGVRR
jgi:tape measure domain-containing protein